MDGGGAAPDARGRLADGVFRLAATADHQRRLAGGGLDMALRGHLGQDGGMPPPSRHVPQSSRVRPGGHRGSIGKEQDRPRVFPAGVFRHYLKPSDKHHLTGKPVPLMAHLMTVLPAQSKILDPFAGSGSTLAAAQNLGHAATGIELSPAYYRIACNRLGLALAS